MRTCYTWIVLDRYTHIPSKYRFGNSVPFIGLCHNSITLSSNRIKKLLLAKSTLKVFSHLHLLSNLKVSGYSEWSCFYSCQRNVFLARGICFSLISSGKGQLSTLYRMIESQHELHFAIIDFPSLTF